MPNTSILFSWSLSGTWITPYTLQSSPLGKNMWSNLLPRGLLWAVHELRGTGKISNGVEIALYFISIFFFFFCLTWDVLLHNAAVFQRFLLCYFLCMLRYFMYMFMLLSCAFFLLFITLHWLLVYMLVDILQSASSCQQIVSTCSLQPLIYCITTDRYSLRGEVNT